MYRIIYYIGRGWNFLSKRLSDKFWSGYLKAYCRKRPEIECSDYQSLQFSGKTLLAVAPGAKVRIGKNVVINSSHHTVNPTLTKINVSGGGFVYR